MINKGKYIEIESRYNAYGYSLTFSCYNKLLDKEYLSEIVNILDILHMNKTRESNFGFSDHTDRSFPERLRDNLEDTLTKALNEESPQSLKKD